MRPSPWTSVLRCVAIAVVVAGYTATTDPAPVQSVRPLGPSERWLPVARWELPDGRTLLCAGGGTIGDFQIHGWPTDPRLVWMTWPDGHRSELAFDPGWSARFTPDLEVMDPTDQVVAREGSRITGLCPTPEPGVERPEF